MLRTASDEIREILRALRGDRALLEADNFSGRWRALDILEVEVMERIDGLSPDPSLRIHGAGLKGLKGQAEELKASLEKLDEALFRTLRSAIRAAMSVEERTRTLADILYRHGGAQAGVTAALPALPAASVAAEASGYDILDALVNGILHPGALPSETLPREPGRVFFQKTPVRMVLEMARRARLTREDRFYDLGSGLGQVPILVHLLTGAKAVGIECEPAFCTYAGECAAGLGLARVEFLETDLRRATIADGAVCFMYSPCEGAMLEEVLETLRQSARTGMRLFTYGPCSAAVARQDWLRPVGPPVYGAHGLGEFRCG